MVKEKWKTKGNNFKKPFDKSETSNNNEVEKRKKFEEEKRKEIEKIDTFFEFEKYEENIEREGFLINIKTNSIIDEEEEENTCVDLYFMEENGKTFKSKYIFQPYFYIKTKEDCENEVETFLRKRYEDCINKIEIIEKKDLDDVKHLSDILSKYLKISFKNITNLLKFRKEILPLIEKNCKNLKRLEIYEEEEEEDLNEIKKNENPLECIIDIREYDVKYHMRTCIDNNIRIGNWYKIKFEEGKNEFKLIQKLKRPPLKICAFDIETTKLPLMFPDSKIDSIMMISYMIDQQGYLIINRQVVSEDVDDFSFNPKDEYKSDEFIVFNEKNEKELLEKFFSHLKEEKPQIYVTYNGDNFDWPFIDDRAKVNNLNLRKEIGFFKDSSGLGYLNTYALHLDCYYWVKRDSYLPQGSHGLKAVTKKLLGYDPIEVNPEEMVEMAQKNPSKLAGYSVSDAFSTYFLYKKYVHPFIFSLSTIIPMSPDEVLRKGSGTLCEMLLMVQAFQNNIICPNRHVEKKEKMYKGHLIESETYVGGHVEALRSGVFRSDFKYQFDLDSNEYDKLMNELDSSLKFAIEVELKLKLEDIENYEEIKEKIYKQLKELKEKNKRKDNPKIYHLDVGAMYPNIILTNRLQPVSIVNEDICTNCEHNKPESDCQRRMDWNYVSKYFTATSSEYYQIKKQLEIELKEKNEINKTEEEIVELIKKRLSKIKGYSSKYKKETKLKNDIVCQREDPFYVDTVREFKDRRYEYKQSLKNWKKKITKNEKELLEKEEMITIFDSLQLAHKCILNSFYGYVMRRGARWYSMEMAGIVTHTGSEIIKMTRELIDKIGISLELDTDGIWCMLPSSFPEDFKFKIKDKYYSISYPMIILNHKVANKFTNHQYQVKLKNDNYKKLSECSIFFEVDGPYKCMIIPASQQEGKSIKKRYAVFNENNTIAELKGFEIKRRGELQLIKLFQERLFLKYLSGNTLEECYKNISDEANTWLDILYSKGSQFKEFNDPILFGYLTESSNMSRNINEYGDQKSSRITSAKRLGELLGDSIIQEKGLNCSYIVSKYPIGQSVSERVIPVELFHKDESISISFLRKWTKENSIQDLNVKNIIDWDYYIERFGSVIQKMITIPASFQGISNPVERIKHPNWLIKNNKKNEQHSITKYLKDIEDLPITKSDTFMDENQNKLNEKEIEKKEKKKKKKDGNIKKLNELYFNPTKLLKSDFFENDNYSDWLKLQKEKWKKKENRKLNLFSNYYDNLKTKNYQIIQIRETNEIGVFKIFFLIDQQLNSLLIEMKRKIYLNQRSEYHSNNISITGTELKSNLIKILPKNKPILNLKEFELSEILYNDLKIECSISNKIEGIYESNIPLIFNSILEIGNNCHLKEESQFKIDEKNKILNLNDFEMTNELNQNELNLNLKNLKKIYIYHSEHKDIGILSILIDKQFQIFILQKTDNDEILNIEKIWKDVLNSYKKNQQEEEEEEEEFKHLKFQLKYLKQDELFNEMKKIFQNVKGSKIVLLQSYLNSTYEWIKEINELNEYPILKIPFNNDDTLQLQLLNWKNLILKRMFIRYYQSKDWFNNLLPFILKYKIPIGNIENDFTIYLIDVLYSRLLRDSNHLLWIGEENQDEEEIYLSENEINLFSSIKHSGGYSNISCEIEIKHLLMNSILQYQYLEEEEEEIKKSFNLSDKKYLNQFKILQKLISNLYYEFGVNESNESGILIDNLFRWIINPKSKLYDSKFSQFLIKMMRKFWLYLLSNFKKLGCKIIFSNYQKIIIETPKKNLNDTKNYLNYLFNNISKKKLFSWIEFDTLKYWEYLIFIDEINFIGIKINDNSLNPIIQLNLNLIENYSFKENIKQYLMKYLTNIFKKDEKYMKSFIEDYFTPILLNFIEQFKKTTEEIKFINLLCFILSFDEKIKQQVEFMKLSLLKLTKDENENEDDDLFNNDSFILNNFICEFCNSCKNIDLLRDPNILEYKCLDCFKQYNKDIIEGKLIDILKNIIHSFQFQDLECSKCQNIKYQFMNKNCDCSGDWKLKQTKKLDIFKKIGKYHQFDLLNEYLK
eukprot:gene4429-7804_t